tara:strand:- start:144 stop:365 length:222 start_codon:yes stop_codon:yes gene_type:complete
MLIPSNAVFSPSDCAESMLMLQSFVVVAIPMLDDNDVGETRDGDCSVVFTLLEWERKAGCGNGCKLADNFIPE